MTFPLESNGATRKEALRVLRLVNDRQRMTVRHADHPRKVYGPSNGGLIDNPDPDPMSSPEKCRELASWIRRSARELELLSRDLDSRANALEKTPEAYR